MSDTPGLPGRKGQAARNDEIIMTAAREVFLADPKAPVAAVAERAGVGISALYRRYPSKDDMLRRLCHDGLRRFIAEAEAAGEADPWNAFQGFIERIVDADVHSLTVNLAGLFRPTPEMSADASRANELADALFARAQEAGGVRDDAVQADIVLLLEACAAIRLPDDAERTRQLRRRFLAQALRGLRPDETKLPGPPPGVDELSWRWRR